MQRQPEGALERVDAEEAQRRVVAIEHSVGVEKDHRIAGELPDGLELLFAGALRRVAHVRCFVGTRFVAHVEFVSVGEAGPSRIAALPDQGPRR
jgi:hypothetical protein